MYKEKNGETPDKDTIANLAKKLGLSENQIYKWFWDTKKKLEDEEKNKNKSANDTQTTGRDGKGNALTPYQIK